MRISPSRSRPVHDLVGDPQNKVEDLVGRVSSECAYLRIRMSRNTDSAASYTLCSAALLSFSALLRLHRLTLADSHAQALDVVRQEAAVIRGTPNITKISPSVVVDLLALRMRCTRPHLRPQEGLFDCLELLKYESGDESALDEQERAGLVTLFKDATAVLAQFIPAGICALFFSMESSLRFQLGWETVLLCIPSTRYPGSLRHVLERVLVTVLPLDVFILETPVDLALD